MTIYPDAPPSSAPWLPSDGPSEPDPPAPPAPPASGRPRPGRTALLAGVVGALVGALVSGGLVLAFDDDPAPASGVGARPAAQIGTAEPTDIRALLDTVQPSVVSIEVNGSSGNGIFKSAGSGVVISDDGLVLTNAHVISGATSITVRFFDGSTSAADLVGSFPDDDVALVRVADTDGLVPATLGSSADLQVGDEVVAIGNALDLTGQPTVTEGIVSALDRQIDGGGTSLDDLIQTDAAINPGNSGGALVAADGTVVGIPTAIIGDAQNIGFAIEIDAVKPLIEDIRAGRGEVTPNTAFLGVSTVDLADVDPAVRERFGIDTGTDAGALVQDVTPGTAAADAGLEIGDVIVAIDGDDVTTSADVRDAIRAHEPGDEITITVERQGDDQDLGAQLGAIGG
jgi:S1-C subfamily serine protease